MLLSRCRVVPEGKNTIELVWKRSQDKEKEKHIMMNLSLKMKKMIDLTSWLFILHGGKSK
jgi:hypothetical protein